MVTRATTAHAIDGIPTYEGSPGQRVRLTASVEDTHTRERTSPTAIRVSLGLVVLWAVLAAIRPGTTFHLAPLLVAGAVPWVHRLQDRPSRPITFRPAMIGLGLAGGASVVLALVGLLDGPSLLPFGGALEESLAAATIGGLAGLAVAALQPHRAWVG